MWHKLTLTRHIDVNQLNQRRGEFITAFAKLERSIDLYLATYFTGSASYQTDELIDILIDRLPFAEKKNALKVLIDQKDEEDFKAGKHRNKKINHKALVEKLRELAVVRNQFAHYGIDHSPIDENIAIKLFQHRDGTNTIEISNEKFNSYLSDMERCRLELIKLREEAFGRFTRP